MIVTAPCCHIPRNSKRGGIHLTSVQTHSLHNPTPPTRITRPGKWLCTATRAPETLPVGGAGRAEFNAFFPSPSSLGEFTSPTVEINGDDYDDYPEPYTGSRKIPMIAADERYLPTAKGRAEVSGGATARLDDTRAVSVFLRH